MQTNEYKKRIRIVMIAIAIIGGLCIARLFQLQILNTKKYKDAAEHQYLVPKDAIFDRGNIYFTNKDGSTVAAATISTGFKLTINPDQIKDPNGVYNALNDILPIDQDFFNNKINKKNDTYEELATHLDQETADKISALKIPRVSLVRDKWRAYPGDALAAQTLGFVSYKDNSLIGRYGLEGYYNDVLTRTSSNLYVNFFAEIFANVSSTIFKNNTSEGDVVTSIEPTVQTELETLVNNIQDKYSSQSVGAMVMDPYTGEIVAMAHTPSFDPNNYSTVDDIGVYKNALAQDTYEMGSIVKPVIMASAIDAGVVTPATSYFDSGEVKVQDRTIRNFDHRGRGAHTTMQDVLNQSLNTGMVFVEQKMGTQLFHSYVLDKFKLGDRTGIDLPGEVSGQISGLKGNNEVNYANAAFGQGIALTPLEIIRSFSAIANGGYLVTPHLATKIEQQNGLTKVLEYPKTGPILSQATHDTMVTMLTHVVDDGYHRGLKNYTVAAKTGTAQIFDVSAGQYYTDRNNHSMIGFFPATNPRYVVFFYNQYPKGAKFSIISLGDSFFEMIQFLAGYYNIPPDR